MSDLFLKSNAALDKAVLESTNHEQMREALKAELARQGVMERQGTEYGARVIGQPEPASSFPLSENGGVRSDRMCERVLYPHENVRLVIVGPSEANLDQQEQAIRAAFNRQR
jgi:hypothetical protein